MAAHSCETPRSRRGLLVLTREICECVGRRRRGGARSEGRGGLERCGGGADPLELMVLPGVGTHLLASLTAVCRWLGDRFVAARPDAHEGVEHGLLMSP